MNCYWCEKDTGEGLVFMEGFIFCDTNCEGDYYADRVDREKNNKPPLFIDRQNKQRQKAT